jgi:hypothetical protein
MNFVGIDFGTTKTLVAVIDRETGKPEPVRLGRATYEIPTTIHVDSSKQFLFAEEASDQVALDPAGFVSRIKRGLGTERDYVLNGHRFTAKDLATEFLKHVKSRVEQEHLHASIAHAVVTVPAAFGPAAVADLESAVITCAFEDFTLIPEPVAAGIAWLHEKQGDVLGSEILAFDWGGGTLDIALVENGNGELRLNPELLDGDPSLGGEDIDDALLDAIESKWKHLGHAELDFSENLETIRKRVVEMKHLLSKHERREFTHISKIGKFSFECTRSEYEQIINRELERAISCFTRWKQKADKAGKEANHVLLVGGSSQIPAVRQRLENLGQKPLSWTNAHRAVALGAALHAASKAPHIVPPNPTKASSEDPQPATSPNKLFEHHKNKATSLFAEGKTQEALVEGIQAHALCPDCINIAALLIQCHLKRKDSDAALAVANHISDARNSDTQSLVLLANTLFKTGRDKEQVVSLFQTIEKVLTKEDKIHYAISLLRIKEFNKSLCVINSILVHEEEDLPYRQAGFLKAVLFCSKKIPLPSDPSEITSLENLLKKGYFNNDWSFFDNDIPWHTLGISNKNLYQSVQMIFLWSILNVEGSWPNALDRLVSVCPKRISLDLIKEYDPPWDVLREIIAALCRAGEYGVAAGLLKEAFREYSGADITQIRNHPDIIKHRKHNHIKLLFPYSNDLETCISEEHGVFNNYIALTNIHAFDLTNVRIIVTYSRKDKNGVGKYFKEIFWKRITTNPSINKIDKLVYDSSIESDQKQNDPNSPYWRKITNGVFLSPGLFGANIQDVNIKMISCDQAVDLAAAVEEISGNLIFHCPICNQKFKGPAYDIPEQMACTACGWSFSIPLHFRSSSSTLKQPSPNIPPIPKHPPPIPT